MADLLHVADVAHYWGNDLQLSPTGDLARATQLDRSKQRVLRRLLTNPGDYLSHLDYGAGLPADIGALENQKAILAIIRGQLAKEATVQQSPAPQIKLSPIANGLFVQIAYTSAPENVPAVLSFNLTG